jgi:hypothetical protein
MVLIGLNYKPHDIFILNYHIQHFILLLYKYLSN